MVGVRAHETVLIVEDDDNISFLQSKSLRKAGYDVEIVDSEARALDALARTHIDVTILDYRLPGGRTGLELFADLRAAGHNEPVIMVTGYGDETLVIDALRAGVRDFVIKSSEYLEYLPLAVERVLEQTRLEHRLAEADRQLRHAQKMDAIGNLAGGVAHEFNNLLQAIQGYTRFAMEGLDADDGRRKDLEQVLAASDRAAVLTRQLLGFSRREQLQLENVDPNPVVRELVEMVQPLIGEHITIHLQLAGEIGLVHADAGHIQQILMNLCVNARDAMPGGGTLTIKTQDATFSPAYCEYHPNMKPGRYVVLSVADTGHGMRPEVKNRIFEPFFTTKEVGKGTGLGLAMVYGLIQQHQGEVRVYSEPGIGTTFKMYLPTVDHAAGLTARPEPPPARGGNETILIAEDDPLVRDLAKRILERAGYRTIIAVDGQEAVDLFTQNSGTIALALLDVIMPRLGGRDAYEKMLAISPNARAVFCSGYDPETPQVSFVAAGELRLVQKPFDPQTLLCAVRDALDEIHLGQTLLSAN